MIYFKSCKLVSNNLQADACLLLFSVLEGTADHFAKRVPPNITVIERSENTTVYQGPTQLGVGLESTNLVAILKGKFYFR